MGVKTLLRVLNNTKTIGMDQLALIRIANLVDEEKGYAWVSLTRLAREMGISWRYTATIRTALIQSGELRIETQNGRVSHQYVTTPTYEQEIIGTYEQEIIGTRPPPMNRGSSPYDPQFIPPMNQGSYNPLTDPKNLSRGRERTALSRNGYVNGTDRAVNEERFNQFIAIYPKRQGIEVARKYWLEELKPNEDLFNRIMAVVAARKESPDWKKDGGKFVWEPARWLREKRWTDEDLKPSKVRLPL